MFAVMLAGLVWDGGTGSFVSPGVGVEVSLYGTWDGAFRAATDEIGLPLTAAWEVVRLCGHG